jgi:hypothetical protein
MQLARCRRSSSILIIWYTRENVYNIYALNIILYRRIVSVLYVYVYLDRYTCNFTYYILCEFQWYDPNVNIIIILSLLHKRDDADIKNGYCSIPRYNFETTSFCHYYNITNIFLFVLHFNIIIRYAWWKQHWRRTIINCYSTYYKQVYYDRGKRIINITNNETSEYL